ncbi:myoD family inhibitor domain-containing protein 2-like [Chanos chanos]|uniref:MyoD family inhibitor domain-containing protein 2-like n=1 Tax=Chanos chanos TaxID=29144 RepID=A0A6J2UT79_CHACN|nr:myoD family inhibitor domain-containing protein 2 [Chanos chanos]
MSEVVVSGVRRLSTISEHDPNDVDSRSEVSLGGSEWAGSRTSLCSKEKTLSSSGFTSFESHQPDAGEDCATILLACLFCRFYDIVVTLPGACGRAVTRCFPSCKYFDASSDQNQGKDYCDCSVNLDCNLLNVCQETSEFLELAMEISEVCYR